MDPLNEVITLLRPSAVFAKGISGAGSWGVRYSVFGQPSFCVVLQGSCLLAVDGEAPITLEEGDFLLLPATPGFTMSSFKPAKPVLLDPMATSRLHRHRAPNFHHTLGRYLDCCRTSPKYPPAMPGELPLYQEAKHSLVSQAGCQRSVPRRRLRRRPFSTSCALSCPGLGRVVN